MPRARTGMEIHKISIVTSTLFDPAFYVSELPTSKTICFELQTINFGEQFTIDEHDARFFPLAKKTWKCIKNLEITEKPETDFANLPLQIRCMLLDFWIFPSEETEAGLRDTVKNINFKRNCIPISGNYKITTIWKKISDTTKKPSMSFIAYSTPNF